MVTYLEKGEEEERFVEFLKTRVPVVVVSAPDGGPGFGGGDGDDGEESEEESDEESDEEGGTDTLKQRIHKRKSDEEEAAWLKQKLQIQI